MYYGANESMRKYKNGRYHGAWVPFAVYYGDSPILQELIWVGKIQIISVVNKNVSVMIQKSAGGINKTICGINKKC
jgi:hypothetical protein